jgi:hypothetical protein
MNHLTLHAYEQNGELFLYRCPECGSSGPLGSTCDGHEPPLADPRPFGPERKPVRVPRVGGEHGVSSDSDGNQQSQGGDASERGHQAVPSTGVAGGGSGQGAGSALAQVIADIERQMNGRIDSAAHNAYLHCRGMVRSLTQHPSDGQEGHGTSSSSAGTNSNRTRSDGQEGGVEEAISQFCGSEHHVLCPGCPCSCHSGRDS